MDYTKGILRRLEAIDNFLAGSDKIDAIRFVFVSVPSREGIEEYRQLDCNINYTWKEELLAILRLYEQATPGSTIEEKHSSIVWHYRKADEEFGAWKANQLTEELSALTANNPIKVRHGKKMVEVTAAENNKGAAVARVLEQTLTPDK